MVEKGISVRTILFMLARAPERVASLSESDPGGVGGGGLLLLACLSCS